jgi:DNA-binding CsgD family transcriptional regulator/catechol 2,3-dioxygenase-like lactoylglutathione lyase family enzyme
MPERKRRRGRPPHGDLLTPVEWRVVHAVQHGMTNREIARRRGVSLDAVKFHVANAVAKLGLKNRAALRHWFREPAHSALASQKGIVMDTNVPGTRLAQVARSVRSIEESQEWYSGTLGLTHLYTFGTLAFFDLGGGTRLYLQQQESPAAESVLYLRVADIRAAYEELRGRGVNFRGAPHMVHRHADGTEEWLVIFDDPEGRPLGLMSQLRP